MKRGALACLLALVALPAAAAQCYRVEATASSVSFRVDQAGSPFHGRFREFGGRVCVDGATVTRIDVWLAPGSVDAGLPEIDRALQGADFFDVARHPRVTFKSDAVQAQGGRQLAHGTLEIKGTRRPVRVPFALHEGRNPVVSGAFTLDRLAYGVGSGEWANTKWLGAQVTVRFRAALAPVSASAAARARDARGGS